MIFNEHLNLRGKHAVFSPSNYAWLRDSKEDAIRRYVNSFQAQTGTILHELAEEYILQGFKMNRYDKKQVPLRLLTKGIPSSVVDRLPIDDIFENLENYVNDAVDYNMSPEVILYYSDLVFGTADALAYNEQECFLRIHDLKNGTTPAKIDQLIAYDALFRLQYCPIMRVRPEKIKSELRIYQGGEIIFYNPEPDEIIEAMEQAKSVDKYATGLK